MTPTLKPLHQQTLVITGASSGIGLATAEEASRRGARVVLASRNEAALRDIVARIEAQGGQALAVPADVGRRAEVERIAAAAIERFGGFDTWVNNAGVGLWARAEDASEEDARRLFDTNYWGVVHGSLVAVQHLRQHGGALINIGSLESDRAMPLHAMYAASKHAAKAFTDTLRMELEHEGAPVVVTLVKPGSIGTPFTQHARNYTGREAQLAPPVYRPRDVALAILDAACKPHRDVFVGASVRTMSALGRYAPRSTDKLSERFLFDVQLANQPPAHPMGALHESMLAGRVEGDHPHRRVRPSLSNRARLHPGRAASVLLAAGAGLAALLVRRRLGARWHGGSLHGA